MQVILIGGKARSGKDTLADYLYEELEKMGRKPCKIQVGQYIKYYAIKYFGWDGKEETKPRDLLIKIGTEIIREKIDSNFHINRLIEDIKVLSYFYDTFIVSDVRLPIEIEKPKEEFSNVVSIKLERPYTETTKEQQKHITEIGLDNYHNFDYVIKNDKSLEELKEQAIELAKKIGGSK